MYTSCKLFLRFLKEKYCYTVKNTMYMLYRNIKPSCIRAPHFFGRVLSTKHNVSDKEHTEIVKPEHDHPGQCSPIQRPPYISGLKLSRKKAEVYELLDTPVADPDASVTPYLFTSPDKAGITTDTNQHASSSLNHFLSHFSTIKDLSHNSSEQLLLEDGTSMKQLSLDGKQLDSMFGLIDHGSACDKQTSSSEDSERKSRDDYFAVTEVLNNYLQSAGETLTRLFSNDNSSKSSDFSTVFSLNTGHGSENEFLHNIVNPIEAYTCCFQTPHENHQSLNLLATVNSQSTQVDLKSTNQSTQNNHVIISSPGHNLNNSNGLQADVLANENVVYCSSSSEKSDVEKTDDNSSGRPSRKQLTDLQDYLADHVPHVLSKMHEYKIYKPDVVFENNWVEKPYIIQGLFPYARDLASIRWKVHLRYANVIVSVLKMTIHEEDGSIKIRWRMSGLPQMRALMFWNFLPWNYKKTINQQSTWFDGLSTLYVCDTGHIYNHTVERVITDEETSTVDDDEKVNLVDKLKKIAVPPIAAPTLSK